MIALFPLASFVDKMILKLVTFKNNVRKKVFWSKQPAALKNIHIIKNAVWFGWSENVKCNHVE